PVMLAYRTDLIAELGIDLDSLKTWEDFVRVGRTITRDLNGDGVPDRYMIDLPEAGSWAFQLLLRQQDVDGFDADGNLAFNNETTVDTILWYLQQTRGASRI